MKLNEFQKLLEIFAKYIDMNQWIRGADHDVIYLISGENWEKIKTNATQEELDYIRAGCHDSEYADGLDVFV